MSDPGEKRSRRAAGPVPPEPGDEPAAGFIPELLRRGLTLGFSGLFLTEEVVRRALGDTVPRDWVDFAVAQSDRTRAEFIDRLSEEFGRVLESIDVADVAGRLMEGHTLEVTAKIRLVPDDGAGSKAAARRKKGGARSGKSQ